MLSLHRVNCSRFWGPSLFVTGSDPHGLGQCLLKTPVGCQGEVVHIWFDVVILGSVAAVPWLCWVYLILRWVIQCLDRGMNHQFAWIEVFQPCLLVYHRMLTEIWVAEDAASMLWAELRRPLWKVWSRLDGYCTSCITLCNVLEDIRNLTWAFRDRLGSWNKSPNSPSGYVPCIEMSVIENCLTWVVRDDNFHTNLCMENALVKGDITSPNKSCHHPSTKHTLPPLS